MPKQRPEVDVELQSSGFDIAWDRVPGKPQSRSRPNHLASFCIPHNKGLKPCSGNCSRQLKLIFQLIILQKFVCINN